MDAATASIFGALAGAVLTGGFAYLRSMRATKDTTYVRQVAVFEDAYIALTRYRQRDLLRGFEDGGDHLAEDVLAADDAARTALVNEFAPRLRITAGRDFEEEFLEALEHIHNSRVSAMFAEGPYVEAAQPAGADLVAAFEATSLRKESLGVIAMQRFADHCANHLVGRHRPWSSLIRRRHRRAYVNNPGGDPSAAPSIEP